MSSCTAQSCCLECLSHRGWDFLSGDGVFTMLESQSLNVVGQILLPFLSDGIRKFSGGIAGMWG